MKFIDLIPTSIAINRLKIGSSIESLVWKVKNKWKIQKILNYILFEQKWVWLFWNYYSSIQCN